MPLILSSLHQGTDNPLTSVCQSTASSKQKTTRATRDQSFPLALAIPRDYKVSMNQPDKCAFCGSTKLFPAEIFHTDGGGIGIEALRFPGIKDFPWWKFASAGNDDAFRYVSFERPTACLGCGMLWAKYDLARTRQLVERHGSQEMKAAMGTPDAGNT